MSHRAWAFPTMGGKQLWADRVVLHQWRIQRHALTGQHRLLDPRNRRHARGTLEACQQRLDEIRHERSIPAMRGEAVVVLHGLFRSRASMQPLCRYLRQAGSWHVLNVGYPTTRGSIADHAATLAHVLQSLDEVGPVHFVAHSMGNLVIRRWWSDRAAEARGPSELDRVGRWVMLGPPNQGALLARRLVPLDVTGRIVGKAAQQLATDGLDLQAHLAIPGCCFGILAGGTSKQCGTNPLVPGDDDGMVGVQETRLPGAHDFRVLPVWHMTMMNNPTVRQYTVRFLRHGHFESKDRRLPIRDGR